jgi:hypothetical protein
MSKLNVVIQSTAGYVNELWGQGTPVAGMKQTAELAHRYGLPVTWSVNALSAKEMARELTAWHAAFGDDVCLWLKPGDLPPLPEEKRRFTKFGLPIGANKELIQWGSYADIRRVVENELAGVEAALPWAVPVRVAAGGDRSTQLIQVLEDLNFAGLWGYLWEHRNTDGLTDAGCPFNLFYASKKSFKCPADYPAKVLGAHWFSYEMTSTFHSRATSVFTNDPNDVLRANICDGRQIDFWKKYFEIWVRNAKWNTFFYYMFHQEAHEMEYSDVCRGYTPEQIENTAQMMDEFFKFLAGHSDIEVTTLPKLTQKFKSRHASTLPTYYVGEQIQVAGPIDYYDFDYFKRPKPPQGVQWPDSFFYYDAACQLFFTKPNAAPVRVYNYLPQHASDLDTDYPEEPLPEIELKLHVEKQQLRIRIQINSPKNMPYGAAIWGDYHRYHLADSVAEGTKILGDQLIFLRFDLTTGANQFEWVLFL